MINLLFNFAFIHESNDRQQNTFQKDYFLKFVTVKKGVSDEVKKESKGETGRRPIS